MSFCPICGEDAVDVFCEQHLRSREPLVQNIKPVTLIKCVSCDRVKIGAEWRPFSSFDRLIKKSITFNPQALITEVSFPTPLIEPGVKEFILPLLVEGTVSEHLEPYDEEYEILVPVQKEACDRCHMASSSYFEGIFQLRNPRDEVVAYIENRVQAHSEVFITKVQDVRGGIDFWFSDQQYLQRFVHEVAKQFGGQVKVQSKLHTYDHQKSKPVYRLTALLRLPKFSQGDVIETRDRLLRINKMGQNIYVYDLRRRKKSMIPCPTDDDASIMEVYDVVLSSITPKPMILHPSTFQEVPLAHSIDKEPGTLISVVEDSKEKWYATDE